MLFFFLGFFLLYTWSEFPHTLLKACAGQLDAAQQKSFKGNGDGIEKYCFVINYFLLFIAAL